MTRPGVPFLFPSAPPGHFTAGGRPAHLPSAEAIAAWPDFTAEAPLRILVSGCLAGLAVGVDGSSYGVYPHVLALIARPEVSATTFCPEAFSFGVPRPTPDIEHGDGRDVLDGRSRVVTDTGEDFTDGMIAGARAMLEAAQAHGARLALLMDISAARGSQVVYRGPRSGGHHQIGQGVAAALLSREGIAVVSQRDHRTLDLIACRLDGGRRPDPDARDHHESDWYRERFGA